MNSLLAKISNVYLNDEKIVSTNLYLDSENHKTKLINLEDINKIKIIMKAFFREFQIINS